MHTYSTVPLKSRYMRCAGTTSYKVFETPTACALRQFAVCDDIHVVLIKYSTECWNTNGLVDMSPMVCWNTDGVLKCHQRCVETSPTDALLKHYWCVETPMVFWNTDGGLTHQWCWQWTSTTFLDFKYLKSEITFNNFAHSTTPPNLLFVSSKILFLIALVSPRELTDLFTVHHRLGGAASGLNAVICFMSITNCNHI